MTPRTELVQPVTRNGRAGSKWTWLIDDYEGGHVFITDDPTGEQEPIAVMLDPTEARKIVDAHNRVIEEGPALSPEPLDVERLAQIIAAAEGFPDQPSLKNRALAEYIVAHLTPEPSDPA